MTLYAECKRVRSYEPTKLKTNNVVALCRFSTPTPAVDVLASSGLTGLDQPCLQEYGWTDNLASLLNLACPCLQAMSISKDDRHSCKQGRLTLLARKPNTLLARKPIDRLLARMSIGQSTVLQARS